MKVVYCLQTVFQHFMARSILFTCIPCTYKHKQQEIPSKASSHARAGPPVGESKSREYIDLASLRCRHFEW